MFATLLVVAIKVYALQLFSTFVFFIYLFLIRILSCHQCIHFIKNKIYGHIILKKKKCVYVFKLYF